MWGRRRACTSEALPALVVSPPGPCLPLEHVVTVVNDMIYSITWESRVLLNAFLRPRSLPAVCVAGGSGWFLLGFHT